MVHLGSGRWQGEVKMVCLSEASLLFVNYLFGDVYPMKSDAC